MEIDNLIYIIITLIIFVVSIIGQSKKKKAQQPIESEEEMYSLNDFEKIMEEKEAYTISENSVVLKEPVIPEKLPEQKKIGNELKPSATQRKAVDESEVDDGFDIKSAIIYSSILERKKFRR